uniref:Uncharacterized protein n=1 Tax=Cucumis melo subsp. melo TaxID=412675 RepID=E5GCM3_CUCME|nr:hypothetical protein [Cucumis melo subsp. melo]
MRRDRDGSGRGFNGRGRGGDHDCGRRCVGCRDEEEKWVSTTKLFMVMDKVEYKQLDKRRDVLPGLPFVALTATTTEKYR